MKDRSFKIVAVVALVMALSGLVVAYAAYSTTLKVSGTVTAKSSKQSWDVQFKNLSAGARYARSCGYIMAFLQATMRESTWKPCESSTAS